MQLSYKIVGLDKAQKRIKALADATPRFLEELAITAVQMVWHDVLDPSHWAVGAAQPLPPPGPLRWLTGNLARSTQYDLVRSGNTVQARLFNTAPYATVHEDGARPFISPAYLRQRPAIEALFRSAPKALAEKF